MGPVTALTNRIWWKWHLPVATSRPKEIGRFHLPVSCSTHSGVSQNHIRSLTNWRPSLEKLGPHIEAWRMICYLERETKEQQGTNHWLQDPSWKRFSIPSWPHVDLRWTTQLSPSWILAHEMISKIKWLFKIIKFGVGIFHSVALNNQNRNWIKHEKEGRVSVIR